MELPTPHEFVYRFMTRTGRVDLQRLQAQFPNLMAELAAGGVAGLAAEQP